MSLMIFLAIIFLASFALTGIVRSFSLRKAILDMPNERSSHTVPTPRGGGVAIALTFFIGIIGLLWQKIIPANLAEALLGGGIIIAGAGYWDDVRSLPAKIRFLLHLIAAIWVLYCLHGFPILDLGTWKVYLGWFGTLLAIFGIIWLINLYNFMDGIDGIAGSEAVFVTAVSGITLYLIGAHDFSVICFLLLVACLGFLLWNWPPAKIFMGDVGSGLLGFILAVLAIASAKQNTLLLLPWLTLLGVFVLDATFTLMHRIMRKQKWYAAHREHIYQRLIQRGFSHQQVTLSMNLVNILILLPLFSCMVFWPRTSVWLFLLMVLVFTIVWRRVVKL